MNTDSPRTLASGSAITRAVLLAGLFLVAVGSAWAWYNVNPKRFDTVYQFQVRDRIPGLEYRATPVDAAVVETLATTNLVSGVFVQDQVPRFTVFMGTWHASDSKQMGVVAHTPDICWVGAGWTPVALGQPSFTELDLGGHKIPFELRAFQSRDKSHIELTLWCTLISGQVFEESNRFEAVAPAAGPSGDAKFNAGKAISQQGANSRAHSAGQFARILRDRIAGDGSKQFIRFSMPVDRDWRVTLADLQGFARRWIELEVTHPSAVAAR